MKDDFSVEKGVPIPVKRRPYNEIPVNKLGVGESIQFPKEARSTVQSRASRLRKRDGKEFTIRTVDEKSCRIWRTK